MSNDQILAMLIKRVDKMEEKNEINATLINKLFVQMGQMRVKLFFITAVFSTIGSGIGIILIKYIFKGFE